MLTPCTLLPLKVMRLGPGMQGPCCRVPMAGQQNPSSDLTDRREEATSQDHPRHRTAGTGVGSSERVAMRNQNSTSLGEQAPGLGVATRRGSACVTLTPTCACQHGIHGVGYGVDRSRQSTA